MSDSGGEKQFDATPSRVAKAKREGNSARSHEFGANVAFLASILGVIATAAPFGEAAMRALAAAARGRVAQADVAALAAYALVPAVAAALAGIASGLVQSGGLRVVPVVPKFERLNPVESLKRMLSRETTTHAARAAVAFAIAVAAVVPSMRDMFATMGENAAPQRVAALAWMGAQHVAFGAGAVGTVFAFAEYGVARRAWLQKLKMSFDELKRDIKESDGDPATRGRRKALHRALLRGAVAKVKDASFVVVNPTHVAIALQYRPPEIAVPTVLVRAADDAALAVRKLALEHRVPVIENVALARSLYRDAHVGAPIPHAHYVAVAEIVAALSRGGVLS